MGACRNTDYCKDEREALAEEALAQARARGHDPGHLTRLQKGLSVFQTFCARCGRSLGIDVNPAPGELSVFGDALTTDCLLAPVEPPPEAPNAISAESLT
jgi:hypothetical protein